MQGAVWLHHLPQAAIHPKTYTGMALIRLNVNITRTISDSLSKQSVEHANDGGIIRRFEQIFNGRQFLHHPRQVGIALHFIDNRRRA